MLVIGITGGIGSGKSKVMNYLLSFADVFGIFTDEVAKVLMKPGQEGYKKLVKVFGNDILSADGNLDTTKLNRLFESEAFRLKINKIIHPLVLSECERMIELHSDKKYIFIESALLFESKANNICDEVWYVQASIHTRVERLMAHRGYSYDMAIKRIKSQKGQDSHLLQSDFVIQNDQDFEFVKNIIRKKIDLNESL